MPKNYAKAFLALSLVLCLPAALIAQPPGGGGPPPGGGGGGGGGPPPPSETVQVDCTDADPTQHDSINDALQSEAQELTVEISGTCLQEALILRDNVTLRGINLDAGGSPTDVIQAVSTDPSALPTFGAVVQIQQANNVTIDSLKLTGGTRHAIRGVDSALTLVTNCLLVDNGGYGLRVIGSFVTVRDTTVSENGFGAANAGSYGRLRCSNCIIDGLVVDSDHSRVDLFGGSTLDGTLFVNWKSNLVLGDLTQNSLSTDAEGRDIPNNVGGDSFVRTFSNTTLLGLRLRAFSTARLVNTDVGDLGCVLGADATCETGVTGTNPGCGQCPELSPP